MALALLVLAACGDKLPARPDDKAFRALDEFAKCKATAPRATLCTDELIVAQAKQVMPAEIAKDMEDELGGKLPVLEKDPRGTNRDIHKITCLGDDTYADAVFACWAIADCKQFADCVVAKGR